MSTPNRTETGQDRREPPEADSRYAWRWWCLDCLAGGVVVSVGVLLFLPLLVELLGPLGLLSTTALAAIGVATWLLVWTVAGATRNRVSAAVG